MECSVASQKILLLLYGELDPAERLEIERHIEACQACGVVLAEERRLQAILNQRPSLDPPAELLQRFECKARGVAIAASGRIRARQRTPVPESNHVCG